MSRFSIVGEGNLKILNMEDSDRGTYQCRAENREDSTDVSATIDVHGMFFNDKDA
jgi:neogenin